MAVYTDYDSAATGYLASTDYADGAGDVTKARNFRSACTALILTLPSYAGRGGASTTFDVKLLKQAKDDVSEWLAAHDTEQTADDWGTRSAIAIERRATI